MDGHERLEQLERALIAGHITRRTFIVGAVATGLVAAGAVQALAAELDGMREVQARNTASLKRSYDYIVVGAGSAGCALVGHAGQAESSAQHPPDRGGRLGHGPVRRRPAPVVHQPRHRPGLERRRPFPDPASTTARSPSTPAASSAVAAASTPPSGPARSKPTSTTGPRRPAIPGGATSTGERCSRASRTGRAPRTAPSAAPAARSGSSPRPTPAAGDRRAGGVPRASACPWSTT